MKAGVSALTITETKELNLVSVVIRWGVPSSDQNRKLTVPSALQDTSSLTIPDLIKGCVPVTFGYNGQDILDTAHKQGAKLDSDQFCTTFNPYEIGIIDAISQALIPGVAKATQTWKYKSDKEEIQDMAA